MTIEDDRFIALGPVNTGAAFQANGPNNDIGGIFKGISTGVIAFSDTSVALVAQCNNDFGWGVAVDNTSPAPGTFGLVAVSNGGRGIQARGAVTGVHGISALGDGVTGETAAADKSGVFGFNPIDTSERAFGVAGTCNSLNSDSAGVLGFSDRANGVVGDSKNGNGVRGHSALNDGVSGIADANGRGGVFGFNTSRSGVSFGVIGIANSSEGAGVNGFSELGYGGHLVGGRAPLHLEPANTPGRPTTGNHQRGELFVDSNGDLFYCRASGTPGEWFRVQLAAA